MPDDGLRDQRPENGLRDPRPENGLRDPRPGNGLRDQRPENGLRDQRPEDGPHGQPDPGPAQPERVDQGHVDPQPADPGQVAPRSGPRRAVQEGRRRLAHSLVKPGKGQLIAAAMLFVVGMAGVMQIRANTADRTYAGARREDLVVLLDGLGEQSQRLESEISDLERTRSELQSGADTQRVAREEARQRVDNLSILAGTVPAIGPGIRMTIADPQHKMTYDVVLDAVEEMRDAGGEVIEINDSVRVVASTWFGSDADGLVVDGRRISAPYEIEVIGDPHSLEEAARFRGGIVSEITGARINGRVQIEQLDRVTIDSLHAATENQYARPASPQPTPR